ncbi:hypothetical protein P168DRAFT_286070 [Aspergillus campestris IBT 28561]|uniref:Uncharacterized protein n=1 Tax=Aspergillus campestris (strain IBT 28561) TaxID=1392248 RepID=A0A2I1DDE4_ASPC2|nr:uncharacterized protein P168DRAFT_286070 [Aspergillus campestris IBT 28561]PKY07898.1 hypothetical protein P168DRAFT_286070 [Aspergillus campestris IBT 28561]
MLFRLLLLFFFFFIFGLYSLCNLPTMAYKMGKIDPPRRYLVTNDWLYEFRTNIK